MLSVEKGFPRGLHSLVNKIKQKYTREEILRSCTPSSRRSSYGASKPERDGFKLAVCSNSIRESCELMLRGSGILDLFDCVLSNEDVFSGRPNPDLGDLSRRLQTPRHSAPGGVNRRGRPARSRSRSDAAAACSARSAGSTRLITSASKNPSTAPPNTMLQVVIPLGGKAARFAERGHTFPKPVSHRDRRPLDD